MSSNERLPEDLLWEGEHASEVALTALADGEDALLSEALCQHVTSCESCASRFGTQALRVAVTAEAVAAVRGQVPQEELVVLPAPTPWGALGFATLLALFGLVPALRADSLLALRDGAEGLGSMLWRLAWMAVRGTVPEVGAAALGVLVMSAATLVVMGLWLARSREVVRTQEGGAR